MERENPASGTAKALQETFPGIKIEYLLTEKDEVFWKTYFLKDSEPVTLGAFIVSLLGEFLPAEVRPGLSVKLRSEGGADVSRGIRVQVATVEPLVSSDKRPFTLTQAYHAENGKLTIYLESVVAPSQGRRFIKAFLHQARLFGVVKIELNASMIGGSQEGVFVWARYGFIPVKTDWDGMRRRGLTILTEQPGPLAQVRDRLTQVLLDPSPVALRQVVYLSWTVPGEIQMPMKKFLDTMLNYRLSWNGELLLTDQVSSAWIEAYANGSPAPQFTDLLPVISGSEPPPVTGKEESTSDEDNPSGPLTDEQRIELLVAAMLDGGIEEDLRVECPGLAGRVMARVQQAKEKK